jgi:ribonuclease R
VARFLTSRGVPFLRRIHDARADLSDGSLQRFLKVLGHALPRKVDRFAIQKLLDEVRGKPEGFPVHLAVLRSMKQAEYSPAAVGHFALASEHYCHFTSPIRRYPDLTVHRLLDRFVGSETEALAEVVGTGSAEDADLVRLGAHCSANERRAEAAERELMLVLTLRLLEGKLGEEFDGIVTGVANVGLFVQLEPYLIDGLLRFESLSDDWWRIDPSRGAVVGERSGRRIQVGDRLRVAIQRIQIPTRQLELGLATPLKGTKGRKRGSVERRKVLSPPSR